MTTQSSNVVPFTICAASTTSSQICTDDATSLKAEKRSKISLVAPAMSRPGINAPDLHVVSLARANAALSQVEFLALVHRLSAMELIDRFPLDYSSHKDMKGRRRNGCTIAPEFQNFRSFLRHMKSARPSPEWTLDRINPFRKEYGPGLCRWAAKEVQANNRTDTIMLTGPDGRTLPLTEWAKISGQSADTIRARIRRGGWTHAQAITGIREERSKPVDPTGAEPVEVVSAPLIEGWPDGVSVGMWEEAFRAFCSRLEGRRERSLTRSVFFAWIGTNAIRNAERELCASFPNYFPGIDPEPDGYTDHRCSNIIAAYEPRVRHARCVVGLDNMKVRSMEDLIQDHPYVTHPTQAAKVIKEEERF